MKKKSYVRSDLVCLECGNVFSIMRVKSDLHKYGHIKDLWCYKCQKVTKHFEVIDIGKFLYNAKQDIDDMKSTNSDDLEMKAKKLVLQRKEK